MHSKATQGLPFSIEPQIDETFVAAAIRGSEDNFNSTAIEPSRREDLLKDRYPDKRADSASPKGCKPTPTRSSAQLVAATRAPVNAKHKDFDLADESL